MDLATVRADRLRCAHCQDGVSGLADVCVSCRAVYHEDCALELGRCCPERVESAEGPIAKTTPGTPSELPSSRAVSHEDVALERAPDLLETEDAWSDVALERAPDLLETEAAWSSLGGLAVMAALAAYPMSMSPFLGVKGALLVEGTVLGVIALLFAGVEILRRLVGFFSR